MCFMPSPPKMPPPPPQPARDPDDSAQQARSDQQRKARSAQGYGSTIATGPMGDTSAPNTGRKVLLGQ